MYHRHQLVSNLRCCLHVARKRGKEFLPSKVYVCLSIARAAARRSGDSGFGAHGFVGWHAMASSFIPIAAI